MFTFVTLVFKVEIDGRDCDPFAMYRFRGLFPDAFRASSIRLRDADGYSELFSQTLTPDPSALKRFQKPPLPFAFRLPQLPCKNTGSSNIEITLSLAGSAVNHLNSFVVAVEETLKQIASEQQIYISVSSVSTLGPGRTCTILGPDFR